MSLLSNLSNLFTPKLIEQIAKTTNDQPDKVQKLATVLSSAIVGGLVKRVGNESGMNLIFNNVQKSSVELERLGGIFGKAEELSQFVGQGDKIMNTVMPGIKSPIVNMATKYTGVRNSTSNTLCGSLVPIVMELLKRQSAEKKMESSDMATYLLDQREEMLSSLPTDFASNFVEQMGLKNFLGAMAVPQSVVDVAKTAPTEHFLIPEKESNPIDFKPILKWGAVAAILSGLIYGGYYLWSQRASLSGNNDPAPEAKTIVEPTEKDTTTTASDTTKSDLSIQSPFMAYLADTSAKVGKTLKWPNVDFENNSTQLKSEASALVKSLGDLMKNRPSTQVKIICYANDARLPMTNKMLSVKRVFAIKQALIDQGINFVRVDVEGRGDGVSARDSTGRPRTPSMREFYVKFVQK